MPKILEHHLCETFANCYYLSILVTEKAKGQAIFSNVSIIFVSGKFCRKMTTTEDVLPTIRANFSCYNCSNSFFLNGATEINNSNEVIEDATSQPVPYTPLEATLIGKQIRLCFFMNVLIQSPNHF